MAEPILVRRPFGPPPLALRLAAVLVVPLLLYALVATGQKALDNFRLTEEADALRAQVLDLKNENIQLQQQIERERTDTAIETLAREQLDLVMPGDHPIVALSDATQPVVGQAPPPAPEPVSQPPLRQWLDYFFG